MNNLTALDRSALTAFGRNLLEHNRDILHSLEDVAHACVTAFHQEFTDENNHPAFALFRIFRMSSFEQLSPEMQSVVNPAEGRWLTLMATTGDEPAWQDRQQSQGHACIPMSAAQQAPMLVEAFHQLDLKWDGVHSNGFQLGRLEQHITTRFFYVPDAAISPYIVAQNDFVKPYNIKSVIGLGSSFASGGAALAIAFSKISIQRPQVELFAELSPYLLTLLAGYEQKGRIWN
jgi:hypothetical protein